MLVARRSRKKPRPVSAERQIRSAARAWPGEFHGYDSRPAAVRNFVAYSLKRLGSSTSTSIDLRDWIRSAHRGHDRCDCRTHQAGLCALYRAFRGGANTIRRAQAVHPIADLQIEYSLISRGIEREIIPTCRELGIGITAYGVLSRGLISGHWQKDTQKGDFRSRAPRFQAQTWMPIWLWWKNASSCRHNGRFGRSGEHRLGHGPSGRRAGFGVPLIGARRRDRLRESLGALSVKLSQLQLAEIERAVLRTRQRAVVTRTRNSPTWTASVHSSLWRRGQLRILCVLPGSVAAATSGNLRLRAPPLAGTCTASDWPEGR